MNSEISPKSRKCNQTFPKEQRKITPQKGVLSMILYPNEHMESNIDTKAPQNDADLVDANDINAHDETQQSQDLLETSPISRKREDEQSVSAVRRFDAEQTDRAETKQKKVHIADEQRKMDGNDSAWLSNRNEVGSLHLVLPAMKASIVKKSVGIDPAKPTTEQASLTADKSDNESIFANCNVDPLEIDPIEDTQTQEIHRRQKTSSLKRLSRGTPMYAPMNNDSVSSKSVSDQFSSSQLITWAETSYRARLQKKYYAQSSSICKS
jgi:hypothetical protein